MITSMLKNEEEEEKKRKRKERKEHYLNITTSLWKFDRFKKEKPYLYILFLKSEAFIKH